MTTVLNVNPDKARYTFIKGRLIEWGGYCVRNNDTGTGFPRQTTEGRMMEVTLGSRRTGHYYCPDDDEIRETCEAVRKLRHGTEEIGTDGKIIKEEGSEEMYQILRIRFMFEDNPYLRGNGEPKSEYYRRLSKAIKRVGRYL